MKITGVTINTCSRELTIDNTLTNEQGEKVSLKPGAHVEVTVEAEAEATTPKSGDKTLHPSSDGQSLVTTPHQ